VHHDQVDRWGAVTLRYRRKFHHIGVHARAVTRSRFHSAARKTNNANVAHTAAKEKVAHAPIIDQSIPPIIEADTRPMLMIVCRRP
jgi:hypothetical protein